MEKLEEFFRNTMKSKSQATTTMPRKDAFKEAAYCFESSSVESDDSFQIMFQDCSRSRQSSDSDSNDSFIVFENEDSVNTYITTDVFGDSNDSSVSEDGESDTDTSDSGCSEFRPGSVSKSVSKVSKNNFLKGCSDSKDSRPKDCGEDMVDCANIETIMLGNYVPDSNVKNLEVANEREKTPSKTLSTKRVHFSPNPPKVHTMHVWLFAAKQTRHGYWQQFAIDRERFKRRIGIADVAVSWVLKPQHRSKIMSNRFKPWWDNQRQQEEEKRQ